MIGMVLVTHGRLAEELRHAMEHVVGEQRHVDTVCIGPEDDIENRRAEIEACVNRCDTGDGVVLLTDMYGGTPSNLAISMMERKGVEVIAGVNLPMLVKLAKVRSNQPLPDAVNCAETAGRKYIAAVSHGVPGCPKCEDATVNGATVNSVTLNGTNGSGARG
ncbi:MAG: PTS sugar transporter subunit IIA [Acetobacteraceae bacterium]